MKVSKTILLLALLVLVFALFFRIGYMPLKFEEPRRALVALEMEISENLIVPTLNGYKYYNKPPIFNWAILGLFNLFDSHAEWVVRIPTVVSFLLLGLFNFLFFRNKIGVYPALFGSLFFLSCADLLFYFTFLGEIDLFYSLIVYLQAIAMIHFYEKKNYLSLFVVSYILMAIGFLTKGLPSVAFQGMGLLAVFTYNKDYKHLFLIPHFIGFFVGVGIISAYFYAYSLYSDPLPFILRLINESSQRTALDKNWFSVVEHLFSFPLLVAKILLPWIIFLPFVLKELKKISWQNERLKLVMLWLAFNIIPYWLSPGTRERYLYMFLPFLFTLIAYILYKTFTEKRAVIYSRITSILLVILGVGSIVAIFLLEEFQIPNLGIIATTFSLTMFFFAAFATYKKHYVFSILFIAILTCRIMFNLTVLHERKQKAENINEKGAAELLAENTRGHNLAIDINSRPIEIKIPYFEASYQEPYWPSLKFSYYYTLESGKILMLKSALKDQDKLNLDESGVFEIPSRAQSQVVKYSVMD